MVVLLLRSEFGTILCAVVPANPVGSAFAPDIGKHSGMGRRSDPNN